MKITKRQLKRIIREERRSLADNPYAYEGDDVGPGEIPSSQRSELHRALSPLGFEIGAAPGSKDFNIDYLDAIYAAERELRRSGFEDPSIIIDYIKPRLEDIFRKAGGPGNSRTEALVDAIPFRVFDAAAGGRPLRSSTRPSMSPSRSDQYAMYDEEDGMQPMISDSRKMQNYVQTLKENKIKISKRQLKRIINEEKAKLLSEANPDGTISPDEEELEDELTTDVLMELDNLIAQVREEAMRIGGPYRGPGIKLRIFMEMQDMIGKAR